MRGAPAVGTRVGHAPRGLVRTVVRIRRLALPVAGVRAVQTVARAQPPPYDALFCGTDAFACVVLEALLARPDLCRSLHVLTPPDVKHAWGGKRMRVSPVKQLAEAHKCPTLLLPPGGLDDLVLPREMTMSTAPLLLTASFGHRIPPSLLARFPHASHTLNLHPSLLPDLRGAAPIQWAIARQYTSTGITVQQLHPTAFDQGGILKQVAAPVPPGATYAELESQLAQGGAQLLVDVLSALPHYSARVMAQDPQRATRAPKLQPKFSILRWERWSAAQCDAPGHLPPSDAAPKNVALAPGQGTFVEAWDALALQTIDGIYLVSHVQTHGKPRRTAAEWWRGFRDRADAQGRLQFA